MNLGKRAIKPGPSILTARSGPPSAAAPPFHRWLGSVNDWLPGLAWMCIVRMAGEAKKRTNKANTE